MLFHVFAFSSMVSSSLISFQKPNGGLKSVIKLFGYFSSEIIHRIITINLLRQFFKFSTPFINNSIIYFFLFHKH